MTTATQTKINASDKKPTPEKDVKEISFASLSDDKKTEMKKMLRACEVAISRAAKTYAQAAWHIGESLKDIRDNKLFLVSTFNSERTCTSFEEYLSLKVEWQLSRVSAYNFISLTNLPADVVTEMGLTASYKVATMKNPIVAIEAFRKAKEEGKPFKARIAEVQTLAKEERDDDGEKRSPGRTARTPVAEGDPEAAKPEVKTVTTPTGRVDEIPVTKVMEQTIALTPITDPDMIAAGYTHRGEFHVGSTKAELLINLDKNIARVRAV